MHLRIILILLSAVFACSSLTAQKANKKIAISGIVADGNGKPVPNVFITIDGKVTNSITDQKGYYKIKVLPSADKIGFSTIWSEGAEEMINGRTTINCKLDLPGAHQTDKQNIPADKELTDKTIPGSKSERINKNFASYKTIYDLIQGEFPTIIVEGKTIRIPGAVSLKWSTEPLFVVDGIQVTSIDGIIPASVKSIQVLKGSAASIYGMKGANGVIVINILGSKDNNIVK